MNNNKNIGTHEAAQIIGVHRDTLLRWLREKKIKEPTRDRNGWRTFTLDEIESIRGYAESNITKMTENNPYQTQIQSLNILDWDFVTSETEYLNHSVHPYPCKFIPQIPNTLIQSLSTVGETVLDPFCGSGTTLVEALRLNRQTIGIDANPIAALISRVKTNIISTKEETTLRSIVSDYIDKADYLKKKQNSLFLVDDIDNGTIFDEQTLKWIEQWYDNCVILELYNIRKNCMVIHNNKARDVALAALSSILVNVSKQDSDTRYVRRIKNIKPGDTFSKFAKSLDNITNQVIQFSKEINPNFTAQVLCANILQDPSINDVDLVVCSPPYPNAYSYHLYHRSRMLWLGMDQNKFKDIEIGSHRKYSAKGKNAASIETFKQELNHILIWLSNLLSKDRYVCFVLGDSIIGGEIFKNDEIFINVSKHIGYKVEANIKRNLLPSKKSFNPLIGKIKDEHIVILRNARV